MKSQSHHLSRQLIGIAVLSIIVIGWVISILAIHEALRTPKAWVLWATAALSFSVSVILILARMIVRRDDRITAQVQDELKLAREAAERASRSKSDLLASISHEIRTPMNSVLALAALLKRSD
ncbi:MAG TPA: histidine kinase dimerization/phospho-acceptor domain-containing protein, partial [Bdellovibrionales bacterium]|nr:histidine kinase dimerization/phospho-acceptor domain-containing protein [Bdellovibrionales bacterium]